MKNIVLAIIIIIAVLVAGFYAFNSYIYNEKQAVTVTDYKDGEYIVGGERVKLENGFAETEVAPGSASKAVTRYFGNEAKGDLNGDGIVDLVFLLTQETGGSGTFYYLVGAIQSVDNRYQGTNATLIGDRIAPQTTEFKDGLVIVNYAERAPGAPMSEAPSVGKSLYLKYDPQAMMFGEVVQDFEGESDKPLSRIVVKIGERKSALDVSITPRTLVSDSRCPSDVTCVWAGTVEVKATLESGLGTSEQLFKLNTPVTTEAEEITLLSATPAPKSGISVEPKEYLFTFEVKKR